MLIDAVEQIPPDSWDQPSNLEGWSLRDLVGHATDSAAKIVTLVGDGEVWGGPSQPVRSVAEGARQAGRQLVCSSPLLRPQGDTLILGTVAEVLGLHAGFRTWRERRTPADGEAVRPVGTEEGRGPSVACSLGPHCLTCGPDRYWPLDFDRGRCFWSVLVKISGIETGASTAQTGGHRSRGPIVGVRAGRPDWRSCQWEVGQRGGDGSQLHAEPKPKSVSAQ